MELGRNCVEIYGTFRKIPQTFISISEYLLFVGGGEMKMQPSGTALWHKWSSGTDLLVQVAFWYWPSGIFFLIFGKIIFEPSVFQKWYDMRKETQWDYFIYIFIFRVMLTTNNI